MATTAKKPRATREAKKAATVEKPALVYAAGERCFWARDGHILASLYDLEHALSCMERDTYEHHVTEDRNDFADWVEFVLLDDTCASGLRKAKGQGSAHRCVVRGLARYQ